MALVARDRASSFGEAPAGRVAVVGETAEDDDAGSS